MFKALLLFALLLTFNLPAWATLSPATILLVVNGNSASSVALGEYYAHARKVDEATHLLKLKLPAKYTPDNVDTISLADYEQYIARPIYAKIKTLPHVDGIVMFRNLPYKLDLGTGHPAYNLQSVDSALTVNRVTMTGNPYYGFGAPGAAQARRNPASMDPNSAKFSPPRFDSNLYNGMHLVTRIDGLSDGDARALIDRATASMTTNKPNQSSVIGFDVYTPLDSYDNTNSYMLLAASMLQRLGLNVLLNHSTHFLVPSLPLIAYESAGSDAGDFNRIKYANLAFASGAIAETIVSTSGSNIRYLQPGASNGGSYGWNQSQISTLIKGPTQGPYVGFGVTGIKGYVAEPSALAFANPILLFPTYIVAGRTLAESFYAASAVVAWKDVVIGDILCAPYSKTPTY